MCVTAGLMPIYDLLIVSFVSAYDEILTVHTVKAWLEGLNQTKEDKLSQNKLFKNNLLNK